MTSRQAASKYVERGDLDNGRFSVNVCLDLVSFNGYIDIFISGYISFLCLGLRCESKYI